MVDEAIARGRISRSDGADLVAALLARGRALPDLEQLINRGPVEAARRVAGLGPEFPVDDYDDLTAAEVVRRLDGMSKADLRQRAGVRAPQREPQVGARADRAAAGVGGRGRWCGAPIPSTR